MLADTPDSRISGQPTTSANSAATLPPASAPGNAGHSAAAMQLRQVRKEHRFCRRFHGEQSGNVSANRHEGDVAE